MDSFRKIVITDVRITQPRLSKFEYAEIISGRIRDIGKTGKLYITDEEMHIPVEEYDKKKNSEGKNVIKHNDKWYILEDDTTSLAKMELNAKKCPYLILRRIKQVGDTIYAEIVNPNELIHTLH